jgi:ribosome-associated toxin RatA of RatAB toxin-antitoxin module
VVADVERYKDFVPWCKQSTIVQHISPTQMNVELVVGFKYLTERYISHVTVSSPTQVSAISSQLNVFQSLKSDWKFSPSNSDPNHTWVTFQVDFKFKSSLYNELSDLFMSEVVKKMVQAFEQRCKVVDREKRMKKEAEKEMKMNC